MENIENVKDEVLKLIANHLGIEGEEINLSDSLDRITNSEIEFSDLLSQLENHFYINFNEEDKIETVEDLIIAIEDKLP